MHDVLCFYYDFMFVSAFGLIIVYLYIKEGGVAKHTLC